MHMSVYPGEMGISFNRELDFEYGRVDQVSPLIRRVIANNPGGFTFMGTGTYIVGHGNVAVIDPGPNDAEHLAALRQALEGETVTHILITHTHSDHSPAAAPLKEETGAPTYGFGPHPSGDIPIYSASERAALAEAAAEAEKTGKTPPPKEGSDRDFVPDVVVHDGDIIVGQGWSLEALHTPGHISNHLCFALEKEKTLFSGDHVMGWSTSVISAPDGNLTDYMANLRRLLERDDEVYWPTHGAAITDPHPYVRSLIEHREERTRQILARLEAGDTTIDQIVAVLYADVDKKLHPAAGRSVLAHLIALANQGRVKAPVQNEWLDGQWHLL